MRAPLAELHVTSPFGDRVHPVTGVRSHHDGVDYRAAVGTEVFAPLASRVLSVSRGDVGGLFVSLASIDGAFRFGFAHLSEALVVPGQVVGEGDLIALSGASGRITGPHLHAEARDLRRGVLVDGHSLWSSLGAASSLGVVFGLLAIAAAARWVLL